MSGKIKDQNLKKNKDNQKHNKTKINYSMQNTSIWLLLPVILVTSVLPFITKLKEYNANLSGFPWFTYNDTYTDFFLYYKQKFFLIIVFAMAVIVIFKAYLDKRNIVYSHILIPLGVYAALALIS